MSEKFIKDLKKCMVMFGSGQVNSEKQTKNIGIKWTQVAVELKYLIDDAKYWIENRPIAG
jgi:hypothetical protein